MGFKDVFDERQFIDMAKKNAEIGSLRLMTITTRKDNIEKEDVERLLLKLNRRFVLSAWCWGGDRRHRHYLYRGRFIPQDWLSKTWNKLTENPVVDIRFVQEGDEEKTAMYLYHHPIVAWNKEWTLKEVLDDFLRDEIGSGKETE